MLGERVGLVPQVRSDVRLVDCLNLTNITAVFAAPLALRALLLPVTPMELAKVGVY